MTIKEAQKRVQQLAKLTDILAPLYKAKKPADIVAFLAKRKIVGIPGSDLSCPIANYVRKVAKAPAVSVGGKSITVDDDTEFDCTRVMETFVEKFDKGEYPSITKGGKKACEEIKNVKECEALDGM